MEMCVHENTHNMNSDGPNSVGRAIKVTHTLKTHM